MEKTNQLLDACQQTGAFLDLTGIHLVGCTVQEQKKKDGFLHEHQCEIIKECKKRGLRYCAGSDAHKLSTIADVDIYRQLFSW